VKANWFGFCFGVGGGFFLSRFFLSLFALNFNIPLILFLVASSSFLIWLSSTTKASRNDLIFFVSIGFFIVFISAVIGVSINSYNEPFHAGHYTGWAFHKCYVESLNASFCSETVIQNWVGLENAGYSFYPPLTHLIGRLIPLFWLMPIILVLLWLAIILFTDSFTSPVLVFFSTPTIWLSYVAGGTLPFFLALLFVFCLLARWSSLNWVTRLLLVALTAYTHFYTGVFAIGLFMVLVVSEFLDYKPELAGFFYSFFMAFYFFGFLTGTIRVFLIPLLFAVLFFNSEKVVNKGLKTV